MTKRAELRRRINKEFASDPDVDEFLIDYCNDVWKSISRGMSRQEKINHLFASKDESEIEYVLNAACLASSTAQAASTGPCQDGSAIFLQEIARLRHIIQELEHQLAHKTPDNLCVSRDGLEQVLIHCKKVDEYLHPKSVIEESDWVRWTYESLHTLETYFGKYHPITSSFRFVSMIEKSGPKDTYKGLLDAAANIMTRAVEGSERAERELERLHLSADRYESIF